MKTDNKFKSSVSPAAIFAMVLYNLIILGLFILSYFLYTTKLTNGTAVFLLIIEAVFLFPLIFYTYYSLNEDELFIFQWPFTRKKIRYADIFEITDEIGAEIKRYGKVSVGKGTIFIGYYSHKKNKKTGVNERIENHIMISPKDKDLFLIKMGGKFKRARDIAKQLEEEHNKQFEEHYRKKALADKLKEENEKANIPEDIVIESVLKTDSDDITIIENDDE